MPSPEKWNSTLVKKYELNFIPALPPDILIKIRDPALNCMKCDPPFLILVQKEITSMRNTFYF